MHRRGMEVGAVLIYYTRFADLFLVKSATYDK